MKSRFLIRIAAITSLIAFALLAQAQSFKVLYTFTGGLDGGVPKEDFLLRDDMGNLYGTTVIGGRSNAGVVFKLDSIGNETTLYSFTGGADGGNPYSSLVRDRAGSLYGTTCCGGGFGAGVVFKLDSSGGESTLYTFTDRKDGGFSYSGLVQDRVGNLYGVGTGGGAFGNGDVFELDLTGRERALYSFTGGADGFIPISLLRAGHTLFGAAEAGGAFGNGVIFKVARSGKESVLYSFTGGADGASPIQGLVWDKQGNLYGTTQFGGSSGYGVVFKLDRAGTETVLHSFTGGADGADPYAALVLDTAGNLYGTTYNGGAFGWGVVFKLDTSGTETVLHSFTGGTDGGNPRGALLQDDAGRLYGTTTEGGIAGCSIGCGVVFVITP